MGDAGLSAAVAAARLARDGPNALPAPRRRSVAWELIGQLTHFFALILWAAAALALLAGLPELSVAIAAVIVLNGGFAFAQERRADRAAERLHDLVPRRATVIRDGARREIDARELVVGDLAALGAGDRVSADLVAIRIHDLAIDASTLTGESAPERPEVGATLFAGTFVVEGEGLAEVRATGDRTRLAGLAHLTAAVERPAGPLQRGLERAVRSLAAIALSVGAGALVVTLALQGDLESAVVFAIGVTVALVPEGLLPTVTLSLALGAQRLAARHALVRRLEAVETLGSTTIVCTDKTGTLTCNQMAVVEAWTPSGTARIRGERYAPTAAITLDAPAAGPALLRLAEAAARVAGGGPSGDPLEAALHALALRVGASEPPPERARFPFDPRRRRSSRVVGDDILVLGAPDAVLPLAADPPAAQAALDGLTRRGLRVIAVAARPIGAAPPTSAAEAERDLVLLGLLGLEDPPRAGAAQAIAACRRAGIAVVMVTGDHPETAAAIAREVGLAAREVAVVLGRDLPAGDPELGALVDRDGLVLARVDPEDKLRIARALRARGHVVAMTGDGVNDGPALREADLGVAMGLRGTDVAREAADVVLLDDDFATLVRGIEEGRATFANIRRFLTYHLTDNVAELAPFLLWGLSGGFFPLGLGILQVIALDVGTDTLPAVALGAEPPRPGLLDRPPARGRLLDRTVLVRAFGVVGPVQAAFVTLAFLASLVDGGWRPGAPPGAALLASASGAAFLTVVLAQVANAFACRSTTRWPGSLGWGTNPLLVAAVGVEVPLAAFLLGWEPIARVLGHAVPPPIGLAVAVAAPVAVLTADAAWKRLGLRAAGDR